MSSNEKFIKDSLPKSVRDAMEEYEKIQERFKSSLPIADVPDFNYPSLDTYKMMPNIADIKVPTPEERNEYQSASVFMKALADAALSWKEQISNEYQPAVLAVMYGGIQIQVSSMAQVSFHGIRIQGTMNGSPCTMLAHQSTVQVLCYTEKLENDTPKNPIGFIWADNKVEV